jgi:hypothetical protein
MKAIDPDQKVINAVSRFETIQVIRCLSVGAFVILLSSAPLAMVLVFIFESLKRRGGQ